jgi:hypothetical protein
MNNCPVGPNLKILGGVLFNLNGDISETRVMEVMDAIKAEVAKRRAADAPGTPAP